MAIKMVEHSHTLVIQLFPMEHQTMIQQRMAFLRTCHLKLKHSRSALLLATETFELSNESARHLFSGDHGVHMTTTGVRYLIRLYLDGVFTGERESLSASFFRTLKANLSASPNRGANHLHHYPVSARTPMIQLSSY